MEPRSPGGETFGSSLLRSVPKITARHEEEMKLLESLHQHMNKRTKADLDYAAQLAKINAAAVRACPKDTQDEISSIIQVCVSGNLSYFIFSSRFVMVVEVYRQPCALFLLLCGKLSVLGGLPIVPLGTALC